MTTQVPHFYYSTDPSAPQIVANQPQSVLAVLQACLVGTGGTAYGSQASAGWTAPYTDTTNHAIVLQQGSGSGRCLSLSAPATASPGDGNYGLSYFKARGYNTMSAVTTGTNPFPTVAQQATWNWVYASQYASAAASTVNIPWRIAATDRFFYIVFGSTAAGYSSYFTDTSYYFGDLYSYMPSDTSQTVITGWYNMGATVNVAGSPICSTTVWQAYVPFKAISYVNAYDYYCYIYSDTANTYNPSGAEVSWLWPSCQGSQTGFPGNSGFSAPSPNGNFMFTTAYMNTLSATSNLTNLRGELPGCVFPMHTTPFPDQYVFPMGSDNYISWIQTETSRGTVCWNISLDMTAWKQN